MLCPTSSSSVFSTWSYNKPERVMIYLYLSKRNISRAIITQRVETTQRFRLDLCLSGGWLPPLQRQRSSTRSPRATIWLNAFAALLGCWTLLTSSQPVVDIIVWSRNFWFDYNCPLKQNTNPQIVDKWMNDDWFTAETDWKWNKVQAQSIPENAPILISSGIIILSLPDGAAT